MSLIQDAPEPMSDSRATVPVPPPSWVLLLFAGIDADCGLEGTGMVARQEVSVVASARTGEVLVLVLALVLSWRFTVVESAAPVATVTTGRGTFPRAGMLPNIADDLGLRAPLDLPEPEVALGR